MTSPEGLPDQRQALVDLIADQLGEERKLKESLAQRSIGVVTSSGVLVALVLGAASLSTPNPKDRLSGPATALAIAALACFIAAAGAALTVNTPRRQDTMEIQWLREAWSNIGRDPLFGAYEARLDLLTSLRNVNGTSARLLLIAFILELTALILLSTAVTIVLLHITA
ncbi:MAG TPA: hypothetical protein VGS19_20330 [Streptosporangiaceae bacterium]|nr:hypothetical protein [Streptosporangiaceae bacterium]